MQPGMTPTEPTVPARRTPVDRLAPARSAARGALAANFLVGLLAAAAMAQSPGNPAGGPAGDPAADPAVDPLAEAQRRSEDNDARAPARFRNAAGEIVIAPVTPAGTQPPAPGLTEGFDWLAPVVSGHLGVPRTLPERTTLVRRPGRLVEAPLRRYVFVADAPGGPDATASTEAGGAPGAAPGGAVRAIPPMLLMPNRELERLVGTVGDGLETDRLLATGEVFEYRGRNYLLLAAATPTASRPIVHHPHADEAAPAAGEPTPGAPEADLPADAAAADPTAEPARAPDPDPSVEQLLQELESLETGDALPDTLRIGADGVPAIPRDNLGAGGPSDPRDPGAVSSITRLIPDGETLFDRRARLTRLPSGEWSVVFDNDADAAGTARAAGASDSAAAGPDAPLRLLPCTLLQALETHAATAGDVGAILLSGRVYVYGANNYLLPTLFRQERRSGVNPTQ